MAKSETIFASSSAMRMRAGEAVPWSPAGCLDGLNNRVDEWWDIEEILTLCIAIVGCM